MGTKDNPGPFDCYAAAEPNEPLFTLLARDPAAPLLVELWAAHRAGDIRDMVRAFAALVAMPRGDVGAGKTLEAIRTAKAMRGWSGRTSLDFEQASTHPLKTRAPPAPPWFPGASDNANAKSVGWRAYFEGRAREASPFPRDRPDLHEGFAKGHDAAREAFPNWSNEEQS